ncbi:hypothetical protein ACA910_017207 [Epithemia clementina (nom. ined.)]
MKYLRLLITCCWNLSTVASFSSALLHERRNQFLCRHEAANTWRKGDGIPQQQLQPQRQWKRGERASQLFRSNLFWRQPSVWRTGTKNRLSKLNKIRARWFAGIRRLMLTVLLVSIVWNSSATVSHAATTATSTSTPIFHEKIVDNYIKNHMFDNENYDAVSSAYREANFDNTVGSHAAALQEITTSVLGESAKFVAKQSDSVASNPVGTILMSLVTFLEKRGMSQMSAILLLTTIVFTSAPVIFLVGSMAISLMFKRGIVREMKARYGDSYTIDATIKRDDDIEAPDDDEDDDDDDADDDEDDDDDSASKNKK